MGSYSDVALAIRKEGWESLPADIQEIVFDCFGDTVDVSHCGARLFHIGDIKWRPWSDKEIGKLLRALEKTEGYNYKLIVAHHDYPANDNDDAGWWDENPWGIRKYVKVGISYI